MSKITELPLSDTLDGTEMLPVVQGGEMRRSIMQQLIDLVIGPARNALSKLSQEANLFPDPELRWMATTGNGIWIGGPPVFAMSRGRRAVSITNSAYWVNMDAALFGGPGALFSFTATLESAVKPAGATSLIHIRFFDNINVEISASRVILFTGASSGDVILKAAAITIPAGCAYCQLYVYNSGAAGAQTILSRIGAYRGASADYRPALGAERSTAYVASTGSDANEGTFESPFATPLRAMRALRDPRTMLVRGKMIIAQGDYLDAFIPTTSIQGLWLGTIDDLKIAAAPLARVRFINGNLLTSITKTAGYTNVYQCSFSSTLDITATSQGQWIFEHDTPEGLIDITERHPLHLGRSHRSPSYRMPHVASIAAVDTTPGTWYSTTASGTTTLYFSTVSGDDPTASGKQYYLPKNLTTNFGSYTIGGGSGQPVANKGKGGKLEITGITAMYGYVNFSGEGLSHLRLEDCEAVGSLLANINNGTVDVETVNFRSIAAGADGVGAVGNTSLVSGSITRNAREVHYSIYIAFSGDDGASMHNRCNATFFGGLSEYNNDTGVVFVLGAELLAYSFHSRKNGQALGGPSGNSGEGFALRQAPPGSEGGVNTSAVLIDCISEDQPINFQVAGGGSSMKVIRGISRNASVRGYATLNAGDYLEMIGCTSDGDAVVKYGGGFGGGMSGTIVDRPATPTSVA